ncbi:MAG: hypothetical protein QOF71_2379 [Candidatus Eremiobacteraeota bacterium]|nr:hypothetical protein [Candidatus Eremiobacteraeota bacterium]
MGVLYNRSTSEILSERVGLVHTRFKPIAALLPRRRPPDDGGLWFDDCDAFRRLGARARADLIFLDRDLCVVRLEHRVAPGRPILWCRETDSVLAMSDGFFARADVLVGDLLWFEDSLSTLLYAVRSRTA